MMHPSGDGRYYCSHTAEWVWSNYTIWTSKDWNESFGPAGLLTNGVDDQGRHWETFGYRIPLYDEDDEP